jgi:hypothetical protein
MFFVIRDHASNISIFYSRLICYLLRRYRVTVSSIAIFSNVYINSILDINECAADNLNSCDKTLGVCTNTDGSYTCQCKPGYTGDGRSCTGQ